MNETPFNSDIESTLPPKRSTFLTVLCVLTFLGSAYGIFSGLSGFMTADKVVKEAQKNMGSAEQAKAKEDLQKQKDNPGAKFAIKMMDSVKDLDAKKLKQAGMGGVVANVLTLLGALLMWRLNRKGFYLYIVGIVASISVPFIVFGSGNMLGIIGSLFSAFIGVIFIAMYAFNLKDMK